LVESLIESELVAYERLGTRLKKRGQLSRRRWDRVLIRIGVAGDKLLERSLVPFGKVSGLPGTVDPPADELQAARAFFRRDRGPKERLHWDRTEWHPRLGDLWLDLQELSRRVKLPASEVELAGRATRCARTWSKLTWLIAELGPRGGGDHRELARAKATVELALLWLAPLAAWEQICVTAGSDEERPFSTWASELESGGRWLCALSRGVLLPPSPGMDTPVHLAELDRDQVRYSVVGRLADPDHPLERPELEAPHGGLAVCDLVRAGRRSIRSVRVVAAHEQAEPSVVMGSLLALGLGRDDVAPLWLGSSAAACVPNVLTGWQHAEGAELGESQLHDHLDPTLRDHLSVLDPDDPDGDRQA
jgi:hypothetical protein